MKDRFSLSGKTVLVTGASSGIGRQVAVSCAEMGASVVLTARRKELLDELLNALPGEGHIAIPADLTDLSNVSNLVEKMPSVTGIVHCAGVGSRTICKNITSQYIDNLLSINFKAPVILQTEILKQNKLKRDSSVVFLASRAADYPSYGNAIYSASKGALLSYAKCLGLELAHRQIRVNCISPAMVWTDLIMQDGIDRQDLIEAEKRYPLKRFGTPDDIAGLVVYLLSDASSWMTGSNVAITGGGEGTIV